MAFSRAGRVPCATANTGPTMTEAAGAGAGAVGAAVAGNSSVGNSSVGKAIVGKAIAGSAIAGSAIVCTMIAGAASGAAAAELLQPHRAIYDLNLVQSEASASMVSAKGRLVFEMSGSSCEGYTVNSRFVTRVVDREGISRVTDLRSATFEQLDPPEFTFLNQTYIDEGLTSVVKGSATTRDAAVAVTLAEPKTADITLGHAVFPTAHTRLIIDAAQAGERVLEAPVFDGGDAADRIYSTTTVIGPPETGMPGTSPDEMAALSGLPTAATLNSRHLTISYFAPSDVGEPTPDYTLTFDMLDNGVSYNATFDYGAFVLSGRLAELELYPVPACVEPTAGSSQPEGAGSAAPDGTMPAVPTAPGQGSAPPL